MRCQADDDDDCVDGGTIQQVVVSYTIEELSRKVAVASKSPVDHPRKWEPAPNFAHSSQAASAHPPTRRSSSKDAPAAWQPAVDAIGGRSQRRNGRGLRTPS